MCRVQQRILQDLGSENAALENVFRRAASRSCSGAGGVPGSSEVAAIHAKTVKVEQLVSKLSSASSELLEALGTGGKSICADDASMRRGLNTTHLQELIERGLQLRAAAKQFLVQVLVRSDCLTISPDDVRVADAGALGQGLFAARDIDEGRKIGEYIGELLDSTSLARRYGTHAPPAEVTPTNAPTNALYAHGEYVLQTSETTWVDAVDPARSNHTRFINHAEDGARACNCCVFGDDDRRIVIFATRRIASGEQLFMCVCVCVCTRLGVGTRASAVPLIHACSYVCGVKRSRRGGVLFTPQLSSSLLFLFTPAPLRSYVCGVKRGMQR
jgi:hypothetical protein